MQVHATRCGPSQASWMCHLTRSKRRVEDRKVRRRPFAALPREIEFPDDGYVIGKRIGNGNVWTQLWSSFKKSMRSCAKLQPPMPTITTMPLNGKASTFCNTGQPVLYLLSSTRANSSCRGVWQDHPSLPPRSGKSRVWHRPAGFERTDRENGLAFVINPLSKSAHATACGAVNDHNTLEDMSARKSMTMPLLDSIARFN